MTTQTPSLVSLQAPKDVSIDEIESELRRIWQAYSNNDDGVSAMRATTFTFVVYEPEATQRLLAALGFYTGPIDGIAGPRTTAAIKSAQKTFGMEVTGTTDDAFAKRVQEEFAKAKTQGKLEQKIVSTYAPDLEGSNIADAIAASNPCRIITLCPTAEEDEGVTAQVSAYCPINKRSHNTLICCEYITLKGTATALERISGLLSALMIPDLPKFLWWKASPETDYGLFKRLSEHCDTVIFDSSTFRSPEEDLIKLGQLIEHEIPVADLNWGRIAAWQELTAEAFDPPERREAAIEIDQITIDYEKGNTAQALLYLGWVASRLKWRPVAYQYEGGDYDVKRVTFTNSENRTIIAELAGIPIADWGNVLGDLISLRLSSTNAQADCCTVLCSETAGCMRMEAGGGAQSCRIQQVTSLADQKTEQLLSHQLQRWGQDVLYLESLKIAYEILQLSKSE